MVQENKRWKYRLINENRIRKWIEWKIPFIWGIALISNRLKPVYQTSWLLKPKQNPQALNNPTSLTGLKKVHPRQIHPLTSFMTNSSTPINSQKNESKWVMRKTPTKTVNTSGEAPKINFSKITKTSKRRKDQVDSPDTIPTLSFKKSLSA